MNKQLLSFIILFFVTSLGVFTPQVTKADGTFGAHLTEDQKGIDLTLFSAHATKVDVYFYSTAEGHDEVASLSLDASTDGVWHLSVPFEKLGLQPGTPIYYGYRVWGPNWPYDKAWTKGSAAGFICDVDEQGNRFNPNKLVLDPYALEVSHDPIGRTNKDYSIYMSGAENRDRDSGKAAPKGVIIPVPHDAPPSPVTASFKDAVIYEVHAKGFTMNDESLPKQFRGTYKGAGLKAAYLKSIGITAVEFLPVQEVLYSQNTLIGSFPGKNYWGYMTQNYFSPERHYAFDQSPGGPTREFREMVDAFHAAGIKVYMDVVYNHFGEGGTVPGDLDAAQISSLRGIDNQTYYQLADNKREYCDNTGCGNNLAVTKPTVQELIIKSLLYWRKKMGVDGFRFDLASVLGNSVAGKGFHFEKNDLQNTLNRLIRELPVRPEAGGDGVDLIAEPWAIGDGTYQLGNFPHGWAEWNDTYRDTLRRHENKVGSDDVTPAQLASRFAGTSEIFASTGRRPWHSVNFISAHDGFTLRDIYAYNQKNNLDPDFGPSNGGQDQNYSWDHGGVPALQRQAARNAFCALMLSAGVPMITGGDEFYRTQYGNNNAYNLDIPKNWLNWKNPKTYRNFANYTREVISFRNRHPSLRPNEFFKGRDNNGNGLPDISWHRADGGLADSRYMTNAQNHFLAYRVDASEVANESVNSIYVAHNGEPGSVKVNLPAPLPGKNWYRSMDTASWFEKAGNHHPEGSEVLLPSLEYEMHGRSALVLIER